MASLTDQINNGPVLFALLEMIQSQRPGFMRLVRWVTGGSSYLSSHDKRVLVGLGPLPDSANVQVEIRWPSGTLQRLNGLTPGRYHKVIETAKP